MLQKKCIAIVFQLLIFLLFCFGMLPASAYDRSHPFGLVSASELEKLRSHFSQPPYSEMIEQMIATEAGMHMEEPSLSRDRLMMKLHSYLFAVTADESWAEKAFSGVERMAQDTVYVNDPFSFGLTRASVLRDVALAYDFCFSVWNNAQRKRTADLVYQLMLSVQSSMGAESNNRLESNWMGVRWGSVLLASVILDDSLNHALGRRDIILGYRWDARERLRDHLRYAYTSGGWYVETMGYQLYKGGFVWPALIAYQNTHPDLIRLEDLAPGMLGSYRQHITGTVAIPAVTDVGIRPDLGNDNAISAFQKWPFWIRLLPGKKQKYVRWMHDYLLEGGETQRPWQLFYSALFALPESKKENPSQGGFLNFLDETMGVVMFRNRFQDSHDIVATFNTSSQRFGGHGGPDNLTFRITGLGSVWAVGTGRTSDPTGQTQLFPATGLIQTPNPLPAGKLLDVSINPDTGSGYGLGYGSCVGVKDHFRYFAADYSDQSDADAVFLIMDKSENGRIWRMHTPGFNSVEVLGDGVLLTAPNKSTMKIAVPGINDPQINIGRVRYGGTTERLNPGIGYHGQYYHDNHLIDISCDRDILVVITLQQAGKDHPLIEMEEELQQVRVGNKLFSLTQIIQKMNFVKN